MTARDNEKQSATTASNVNGMGPLARNLRLAYAALGDDELCYLYSKAADRIEALEAAIRGIDIALARDQDISGAMKIVIAANAAMTIWCQHCRKVGAAHATVGGPMCSDCLSASADV